MDWPLIDLEIISLPSRALTPPSSASVQANHPKSWSLSHGEGRVTGAAERRADQDRDGFGRTRESPIGPKSAKELGTVDRG